MKLLALKLNNHDSNFCYYDNGKLIYSTLERVFNEKHFCYPRENLWQWKYDLKKFFNIDVDDVDEIAIVDGKVGESFEKESTYFHDLLGVKCLVTKVSHYLCHALSDWMIGETDYQFVFDGNGDIKTLPNGSVVAEVSAVYKDYKLIHKQLDHQDVETYDNMISTFLSLGNAYHFLSVCALGVEGDDADVQGKTMSLQSYGKYDTEYAEKYLMPIDLFAEPLNIKKFFSLEMWGEYKGSDIVGKMTVLDLAHTIHKCVEKKLIEYIGRFANQDDKIFISGGCAQNIVWNTEIKKHFPNLVTVPHSGDDGLSLGAIEFLRRKNNLPKIHRENFPYWQEDYSPDDIPTEDTINYVAKKLAKGKIIGWYQGHGEVGRRALGNRSILMNPTIPNGKEIINIKVKNRERYRPFGASVLKEHQHKYFDCGFDNPYMLYLSKLKVHLPAINHVDGTCRHQTVDDSNPLYQKLIEKFYAITGIPFVLNTSLNKGGHPICGDKISALKTFYETEMDILVIGNKIWEK